MKYQSHYHLYLNELNLKYYIILVSNYKNILCGHGLNEKLILMIIYIFFQLDQFLQYHDNFLLK